MAAMKPRPKGFDTGIKPTRLWHLTGWKHFNNMLQDLFKIRPPFQFHRHQQLRFHAIVLGSAVAMAYAFDIFKPNKYFGPQSIKPPLPKPPEKTVCIKPEKPTFTCICLMSEEERERQKEKEECAKMKADQPKAPRQECS